VLSPLLETPFAEAHAVYKRHFPGARWADKTADLEMVRCVPILARMYPQARFVFTRRHPINCVLSRRKKFGETIAVATRLWTDCLRQWELVRQELSPERYLEIDQAQLGTQAWKIAAELGKLLELNESSSASMALYLSENRPEITIGTDVEALLKEVAGDPERVWRRRAIYGKLADAEPVYLEDTSWNEIEKQIFMRHCEDMPARYGYQLSRTSVARDQSLALVTAELETREHAREVQRRQNIVEIAAELERRDAERRQNIARMTKELEEREFRTIGTLHRRIRLAKRAAFFAGALGLAVAGLWIGLAIRGIAPSGALSAVAWLSFPLYLAIYPGIQSPSIPHLALLSLLIVQNALLYGSLAALFAWAFSRSWSTKFSVPTTSASKSS